MSNISIHKSVLMGLQKIGYDHFRAIKDAKEKLADSFDLESGKYVLNFDLGERYVASYYVQDNKNQDVYKEIVKDL